MVDLIGQTLGYHRTQQAKTRPITKTGNKGVCTEIGELEPLLELSFGKKWLFYSSAFNRHAGMGDGE